MGEFRSGKSTLINALIGKEVALTDIMETTATLNLYQYGENPEGQIIYTDKHMEQFPPEQLNAILDERRNDEAWLKSIEYVSFNTKSDFLKHISIWDTPGLTGSLFNEKMAKSFIEEVDAALWIFDVNYPGQERIQEFLDELGRRGKKVVGIINKADGFTIEGIRKVQDYLAKVYDGVSFCHWLNVSALRAFEYITGSIFSFPCVTSEAIPDDGGLQELKRYLLEDLLAQLKLLILQASAGDISAVAVSLQEKHSQATSELRRKIWLFKKQIDLLRVKSEETVNMICKEVCDGLRQWLPRSICDDLENELNNAE
jgi:GTPase SAR1 family protein